MKRVGAEGPWERALAAFFARWMLGLLFLMAGWFKVFEMGAGEHARRLFVEPYAESWLPAWLLWGVGTVIPLVELASGGLLLLGWRVRTVLAVLCGLLLVVTYGHLLAEPFFDVTTHVLPRALLVLLLLLLPREWDRWSLDAWLRKRGG